MKDQLIATLAVLEEKKAMLMAQVREVNQRIDAINLLLNDFNHGQSNVAEAPRPTPEYKPAPARELEPVRSEQSGEHVFNDQPIPAVPIAGDGKPVYSGDGRSRTPFPREGKQGNRETKFIRVEQKRKKGSDDDNND